VARLILEMSVTMRKLMRKNFSLYIERRETMRSAMVIPRLIFL